MQPPRVVISGGDGESLGHVLGCAKLVTPLDHISVVATAHTAPNVCRALAPYGGVELIVQLREQRGADVLLPLAHAFAVDPLASIVFLPSVIGIADQRSLATAIQRALTKPDTISVIGWTSNEFAAVSRITCFWDLLRVARPKYAAVLECYLESIGTDDEARMLYAAYENLEEVSFDEILAASKSLELEMLQTPILRRPVSIPPPIPPRARKVSASNVFSGLARVSSPISDAPTMVARTASAVDSRVSRYRGDN